LTQTCPKWTWLRRGPFLQQKLRHGHQDHKPLRYVLAYPGTIFDFYVGDNSVEVVAVKGRVSFVHSATEAKYDVADGSPSILADQQQVSSGEGTVDPDWDQWNTVRENFWAAKARVRDGRSNILPPSLQDEAYALEENGRWERVSYEGTERWFWRPRVVVGWSPFTVGRWTDWYGDQTWIPAEPFGYVTTITVTGSTWGITGTGPACGERARRASSPQRGLLLVSRKGFMDSYWDLRGWVPLAPYEPYYCYRPWGGPPCGGS